MLNLIWGSCCIKFCKLTWSYFLEKWKNRIKETDYKYGSNKRIICGAADIWSSKSYQCVLKVYYEIHYKLMILVGGEFGCHCNAKGSEEECFCTHLSWFGTHDPCLLLSTSYETYSFFTSKSCTSPSRNCSSSLRKFLQGYFVWKKMEVFFWSEMMEDFVLESIYTMSCCWALQKLWKRIRSKESSNYKK